VIGLHLMYRLRSHMYLYFQDFKKRLWINIGGLLAFVVIQLVRVTNDLRTKEGHRDIDAASQYFVYYCLELLSCTIMVLARVTVDLFALFNRERHLLKVSIHQYDYLDCTFKTLISSSYFNIEQLRDELDLAATVNENREDSASETRASIRATQLYIEQNLMLSCSVEDEKLSSELSGKLQEAMGGNLEYLKDN